MLSYLLLTFVVVILSQDTDGSGEIDYDEFKLLLTKEHK
jgi:hypothetical protein